MNKGDAYPNGWWKFPGFSRNHKKINGRKEQAEVLDEAFFPSCSGREDGRVQWERREVIPV